MSVGTLSREVVASKHGNDPRLLSSTKSRSLTAGDQIPDYCVGLLKKVVEGERLMRNEVVLLYHEFRQYFRCKRPFRLRPILVANAAHWDKDKARELLIYLCEPQRTNRHTAHEALVKLCAMSLDVSP